MKAYKLFRLRRDGTLGSLFIDRKRVLPAGRLLDHRDVPTKGYAHRPGWHCMAKPCAPHLTTRGRVWCEVEIPPGCVLAEFERPASQGGLWWTASQIIIKRKIKT